MVWINGPFPAGMTDIQIYREPEGLKSKIPFNKRVIADLGYRGEDLISVPNRLDNEMVKQFKNCARARHETFNGRIKEFSILDERFRFNRNRHQAVFESVCIIVQYEIENGRPLFRFIA